MTVGSELMLAVVHAEPGQLRLEQRPIPQLLREDEVILRVKAVGICGSDLHALHEPPTHPRRLGVVFGHEFAGEVVSVGAGVAGIHVGDLVAVDPNPSCGQCESCRRGSPNFCTSLTENPYLDYRWPNTPGFFWDGGMAEYVRLPAHHVYRARADALAEHLVLAEPLGCTLNAINKVGVRGGETTAVIGAGPIGLLAVAVLRVLGAGKVIVIEPSDQRAEAAMRMGADAVIDPRGVEDLGADFEGVSEAGRPSVVVEAVGTQLDAAVQLAANEARIALIGINSDYTAGFFPVDVTTKELQIRGAFLTRNTMRQAIQLIEGGRLPLEHIVSHVLPLSEIHSGIELAKRGEGLKIVFTP